MTTDIAALDLAKLKELAERSVPGPWTVRSDGNGEMVLDRDGMWAADCGHAPHDAAFIAAAREAVPALLTLVEEQRAEIEELKANAMRMREYRFSLEGITTDGKGNPT